MSDVYDQKFYDKLQLKKEMQVLKPLLMDLKYEESKVSKLILSGKMPLTSLNFKRSFIICSVTQMFRSISVFGIIQYYDRTLRYTHLDLAYFLDVWYMKIDTPSKKELLTNPLVIIKGRLEDLDIESRLDGLKELVNSRKTKGKPTWLFLEGYTQSDFDAIDPELKKIFGQLRFFDK